MLGNIDFVKENERCKHSNLFNNLGKLTTALSIPLFIHSFFFFGELPKTDSDASTPVATSSTKKAKQLDYFELLGSIILASAGLSFRRRYVLEENMKQKFVTDDANCLKIYERIEEKKAELSDPEYYMKLKAFKDSDAEKLCVLPELSGRQTLYPFLFMSRDEIERLSTLTQPVAYMVQNSCMYKILIERENRVYAPKIKPVKESYGERSQYRYDDMMAALKEDHARLSKGFHDKYAALDFEVREKVSYAAIEPFVKKSVKTNGWGTVVLSALVPAIPAVYSTLFSLKDNFLTAAPMAKESLCFDMKKLDDSVRELCSGREQPNRGEGLYRNVTTSLTAKPLL